MTDKLLNAAAPWGLMPPAMQTALRHRMAWESYLVQARALGFTEREARLVATGVMELAKKIPQAVDVLDEARQALTFAELD